MSEQNELELMATDETATGDDTAGTPPATAQAGEDVQDNALSDIKSLQEQLAMLQKESGGLKHALTEERNKRQMIEQQMRSQYREPQIPDPLEDPAGYRDAIRNEMRGEILQTRIGLSREMAMSRHEDYAEMEGAFSEMARVNPMLVQQMMAHQNPAEFAYQVAASVRKQPTAEMLKQQEAERIEKAVNAKIQEILGSRTASVADLRATAQTTADIGSETLYDILKR